MIYEVLWVRIFALTFGNTVYAIGVVLTAFMSGLSIGSYLLGRWADGKRNLLRGYAILEFGIALAALASPLLIDLVRQIYFALTPYTESTIASSAIRYTLSIFVLVIPTTLMGGTLPVLSRFLIRQHSQLESRIGLLYALNTLGGVLGTFAVGFFMIKTLGISSSLQIAAAINIAIGAFTFYLSTKQPTAIAVIEQDDADGQPQQQEEQSGLRFALAAFFISGLAAMVYQVAWSRLLISIIGSSTYSFSLILMGFLIGIGIGSLLVAWIAKRKVLHMTHFSFIQGGIGLLGLGTLILFRYLPELMASGMKMSGTDYSMIIGTSFTVVLLFVVLPATLMGTTFPIIAGIYSGKGDRLGRKIGSIYATNTAGAILGSLAGSFWLLPALGSTTSIKIAALLNIAVAVAGFQQQGNKRLMYAWAMALALPFIPLNIPKSLLDTGVATYGTFQNYTLLDDNDSYLYQKEGLNATISVTRDDYGNLSLSTNGKIDASLSADMSTQIGLAYFPLLIHPSAQDVMVIGLGSGTTVRSALDFKSVNSVDCIEIEPAVLEAAVLFERANKGIFDSPKVKYYIDDARSHIEANKKKYDVIISEPSNPWISGIGNLFSRQFYEQAGSRLNEDGVFAQWIHLFGINWDDLRMIMATFRSTFKDSSIWLIGPGDIVILGSKDRLPELDINSFKAKLTKDISARMKAYFSVNEPLDFFSYHLIGNSGLKTLSEGSLLNTDDLPLLEFNAPAALFNAKKTMANLPNLLEFIQEPSVVGMPPSKELSSRLILRRINNFRDRGNSPHMPMLNKAIAANPGSADLNVQIALTLEFQGNNANASKLYGNALELDSGNHKANYQMALITKDHTESIKYMKRALTGDNDEYLYHMKMASLLEKTGNSKTALQHCLRAETLPHRLSQEFDNYHCIGIGYIKLSMPDKAIEALEKASLIRPRDAQIHLAMASAYKATNNQELYCRSLKLALPWAAREIRPGIKGIVMQSCQ